MSEKRFRKTINVTIPFFILFIIENVKKWRKIEE